MRYAADVRGPAGPLCTIEGPMAIGTEFVVRDPGGATLLVAVQRLGLLSGVDWEVLRGTAFQARVRQPALSLRRRFLVEVPAGPPWEVRQEILADEYPFTRGGREFARVSGRRVRHGLSTAEEERGLQIAEGEDGLLVATLAALLTRSL